MKLCFSTLGCSDRELESILEVCKLYSIEGLEIRGIDNIMDNRSISDLSAKKTERTLALFSDSKVVPIVLGTSCSFHLPDRFDSAIEEGIESIEIAARLRIPYIRVFGNNLISPERECYGRVIRGLRSLSDMALKMGVTVLLEVHGDYNSIERLTPILDALGSHRGLGLIWDVAHSHRVYRRDWYCFYQYIKPYIKHVHIKDLCDATNELTLPGYGDIPLIQIIRTLLSDGYNGYFSLEWERKWHPELPPIEDALDSFLKIADEATLT